MNGFLKIASAEEIQNGEVKHFEVNGTAIAIAIANIGGNFFAINDVCTHAQCNLSDGFIEGQNIVCPCHGSQFDLKTGEAVTPPATVAEKIYEVKVENNQIYVKV